MKSKLWAPAAAGSQRTAKIDLLQAIGSALAESDRLRRERERLAGESVRLNTELARRAEENENLRASAELWIWLYEHQLARANKAVRALAALSNV
jgi:hypothetical protein